MITSGQRTPDSTDCFRLALEPIMLPNGLRVLLHPDESLPLAAVHVCYHVGSKNESPELTGLAHLFEHLMFEGSAQHDDEYFRPLQEAGASVNGSTGHDRTNYFEVVPANFLERALWLEADRMGRLLEALTPGKLENQRAVVKNERLQRIDNQPYGRVSEETFALLYPPEHPYHWPIIGWMEHLDQIRLDDVQAFFRRHYTPANAVLVIAGQFDRDQTLGWVERYFGTLNGTPTPPRLEPRSSILHGEYRRTIDDAVELGRLDILWPTVPRFHKDEAALDVASLLLGDSKDSPLRNRLERDEKLVHSVDAYNSAFHLAGHFGVWAFALPGVETARVEKIIHEVIDRFREQTIAEEDLLRAKRWFANRAYSRVETVLGKAELLQQFQFHRGSVQGDDLAEEVAAYERVTAADIRHVLDKYLVANRVVIDVRSGTASHNPTGELATEPADKHRSGFVSPDLPQAGRTVNFAMPRTQRTQVGPLPLLVLPTKKLPRVTLQWVFDAGSLHEDPDLMGVARLVADCLEEGTPTRSGLEIERQLDILGASLSVASGIESVVVTVRSLRSTLPQAFELLADVVMNPVFAEDDVHRERDRLAAELTHRRRQPRGLADDAIDEEIFGASHPYGRPSDGVLEHLEKITPAHLLAFHANRFAPGRSAMVAVGDITTDELADLVSTNLESWLAKPTAPDAANAAPFKQNSSPLRFLARPEATQSVLRIGRLATDRKTPDYEALVLLNLITGGQFSSRLNNKLREEKGFTYGVSSSFILRRTGGSFLTGTDVDVRVTEPALAAMNEVIIGLGNHEPVTAEELAFAKAYLTRRFPARFEMQSSMLGQLAQLVVFDLPDDYYAGYLERVAAVDLDKVRSVAERYLAQDGLKTVVVGRPEDEAAAQRAVGI